MINSQNCPIVAELAEASDQFEKMTRRLRKDLRRCMCCSEIARCEAYASFSEVVFQAINEVYDELTER
jgi:hypothetical protein